MEQTRTTADGKTITIIPATKGAGISSKASESNKLRVAAYCRVSTTLEEQQGSYNLQMNYFNTLIKSKPEWELVKVYGDDGKTGTSLKGRNGFLEMMDDVRAGKIDYIISKATSRFGRNNAEFMDILDELGSYGVKVFFESEGILTTAEQGGGQDRFMLQVMGAANEQYSSSLSKNIRWSQERNMKAGKVTICYKTFLGYEKGPDGKPKIVEEQAKVVRDIYKMFLEGMSYAAIARSLTEQGIPTPACKKVWKAGTIKSILTNEKYTGDALLQKTYSVNHLDKKQHKNTGQKPQVKVENNHEAIIDKSTFAKVQEMVASRTHERSSGNEKSPFVNKIFCGDCGNKFGHKTWKSRDKISYEVWCCNHKYNNGVIDKKDCHVANLRAKWIEEGYIHTINQLFAERGEYLPKYGRMLSRIDKQLSSGKIDQEIEALDKQAIEINNQMTILEAENEFTFDHNQSFNIRQAELHDQMEQILFATYQLEQKKDELLTDKATLERIIKNLEVITEEQHKFNATQFTNIIDKITVHRDVLVYHIYGGDKIKVHLEDIRKICKKKERY